MIDPKLVQQMIDYEAGNLSFEETVELFSKLIKNGFAWQLQGFYGRTAQQFVTNGLLQEDGQINWDLVNLHKHQ